MGACVCQPKQQTNISKHQIAYNLVECHRRETNRIICVAFQFQLSNEAVARLCGPSERKPNTFKATSCNSAIEVTTVAEAEICAIQNESQPIFTVFGLETRKVDTQFFYSTKVGRAESTDVLQ